MPKLHGLTWESIKRLKVSDNGELYWDGRPVSTKHRLNRVERWMAGCASVAAVVIAVVELGRSLGVWAG